jgi:hypothetical protein
MRQLPCAVSDLPQYTLTHKMIGVQTLDHASRLYPLSASVGARMPLSGGDGALCISHATLSGMRKWAR